jgi:hypothetical protein
MLFYALYLAVWAVLGVQQRFGVAYFAGLAWRRQSPRGTTR